MTVSEYARKEEECKQNTLGKVIGTGQCWSLVQYYVTNYLGVPEWVLAGCGYVNNLLYPPKINDVLQYFDEVPMDKMLKGDFVVWNIGHIAIFDSFDGVNCWYLTQNDGTGENPHGATRLGALYLGEAHAFRLKGITPDVEPIPPTPTPTPIEYNIGDVVEINGIYISSDSEEKLVPAINKGTITNIIEARNPYLLDNGDLGWANNECIVGLAKTTDEDMLDLVRKTIRGDFGNGEERKQALGNKYEQVQYQVERNLADGHTNWEDIRLY